MVTPLIAELCHPDGEYQVAFATTDAWFPELVRQSPARGEAVKIREDATYLITGGLGTLGLHVARWLVAQAPVTWCSSAARSPRMPPGMLWASCVKRVLAC